MKNAEQAIKHIAQVCLDLEARQEDESARQSLQRMNAWALQAIQQATEARPAAGGESAPDPN